MTRCRIIFSIFNPTFRYSLPMFNTSPLAHYFSPDHEQFRDMLRNFVTREILPNINAWDEAGTFPRDLYRRAGTLGLLGLGYPEEYGGTPVDIFYQIILAEEFARSGSGSGGIQASMNSHTIAMPPLLAAGSEEIKRRILPSVISGEKIAALAVTEPSGGSDVAALRTMAVRDGDHYVVNGEKTFITSGMRADYITTAVRTNPAIKGTGGYFRAADRRRYAGPQPHRTEKNGLVGL